VVNHAEDLLLSGHPAERADDAPTQVTLVVAVTVRLRRGQGDAQGSTAGDDRDFADRVRAGLEHAKQGVAGLVVGGAATLLGGHHHVALDPELDLLQGVAKVASGDGGLAAAAAARAAWLTRLAESAPVIPGVTAAIWRRSTSPAGGTLRPCGPRRTARGPAGHRPRQSSRSTLTRWRRRTAPRPRRR
jgi:hypothetical protein